MNRHTAAMSVMTVLLMSAAASAGAYLWENPASALWTACAEWQIVGSPESPCYPNDTGDDVVFYLADDGDDTEVDLNGGSYPIDDLTIGTGDSATVDFVDSGTVSCDTVIVSGPTGTGVTFVILSQDTSLTTT